MVLNTLSLLFIFGGCYLTRLLVAQKSVSSVRASSGITLLFALLIEQSSLDVNQIYLSSVLSGTLLGMTDAKRLADKELCLAAIIYWLIFMYVIALNPGLGGAFGLGSFVATVIVFNFKKKMG